ncbi:hypothetical protein [Amycolatopsis ultiminotia]|uniref:hypothetical protein n=1 Tax=Amycolatopsis ultiminotia TaxID=543629 RepID=UPI0031E77582
MPIIALLVSLGVLRQSAALTPIIALGLQPAKPVAPTLVATTALGLQPAKPVALALLATTLGLQPAKPVAPTLVATTALSLQPAKPVALVLLTTTPLRPRQSADRGRQAHCDARAGPILAADDGVAFQR